MGTAKVIATVTENLLVLCASLSLPPKKAWAPTSRGPFDGLTLCSYL